MFFKCIAGSYTIATVVLGIAVGLLSIALLITCCCCCSLKKKLNQFMVSGHTMVRTESKSIVE